MTGTLSPGISGTLSPEYSHKRHNSEFWNEADKYYHEYQKQVAWLKVYGAALEV